ncbi:hypothetical protein NDU88_005954 [Pleurodeles waltl]|uniref:Uncharacterized protein n=1 Tax=Pleurodeles waltl TaxID=8319 RepID=A0AAV7MEE7_PLEWA|nr:hypothetical protein NDU88_005954 [Pleurodeles waltl]
MQPGAVALSESLPLPLTGTVDQNSGKSVDRPLCRSDVVLLNKLSYCFWRDVRRERCVCQDLRPLLLADVLPCWLSAPFALKQRRAYEHGEAAHGQTSGVVTVWTQG